MLEAAHRRGLDPVVASIGGLLQRGFDTSQVNVKARAEWSASPKASVGGSHLLAATSTVGSGIGSLSCR